MIRVVLYLILIGALAYGVTLLADRPGDVIVTWQGLRIETSVMVACVALLAAVVILILAFAVVRALLRSPAALARHLHNRRGVRAYEAISRGLIAIGAGDIAAARKFNAEVARLAPSEPLALLLSAQTAQLAGDRESADQAFRAMAGRADTKALGLHGLFIEARRREDFASARAYAEEAVLSAPSLGWAGRAALEARCRDGDWAGALALLEGSRRSLDKAVYRRQRAVLLTARALALEDKDRTSAKAFAIEANKLAPTLVPTAALAARLLAEGGNLRKASRIIDGAWRANPHPELARAYAELRSGESARDRLKRIEALAKRAPDNIEGALALARAALDAQEFARARAALALYVLAPTKRVALLMAELERSERNDEGRAREWIARALNAEPDPMWTADGYVSKHWLPVSPVSGRLDAFEWRVPLAGTSAPLIESAPAKTEPAGPVPAQTTAAIAPAPAEIGDTPARRRIGQNEEKSPAKVRPIIPLVHAPDDPGPDEAEEMQAPAETESGGWRKLFG
jgi:HemY protein